MDMVTYLAAILLIGPGAKLMPHDGATKDPSFVRFRAHMEKALARGDRAFVNSRISPAIKYSFGDQKPGRAAFLASWQKSPGGLSGFYSELKRILSLGGDFRGKTFWAPYTYTNWPEKYDAFSYAAATGAAIPVFKGSDAGSGLLGTLNYDIVAIEPLRERHPGWRHIVMPDGAKGWVRKSEVRSNADYRAAFSREHGKWMLTAFVSGD